MNAVKKTIIAIFLFSFCCITISFGATTIDSNDTISPDPIFKSNLYFDSANFHFDKKNYEKAKEYYSIALELNPKNSEARIKFNECKDIITKNSILKKEKQRQEEQRLAAAIEEQGRLQAAQEKLEVQKIKAQLESTGNRPTGRNGAVSKASGHGERQCSNTRQQYISYLDKNIADILLKDQKLSYITFNDLDIVRLLTDDGDGGKILFTPSALNTGGNRILEKFLMECIREVANDVCISPTFSNCSQMGCQVVCKRR